MLQFIFLEPAVKIVRLSRGILRLHCLSAGTNTLTEYSYLVKNIRFSISILPDVKVAANFIAHTIFVTMIMLLYLIWGLPIKIFMLQLPYYYFATFCFTLALTRIISAIQPFFKLKPIS